MERGACGRSKIQTQLGEQEAIAMHYAVRANVEACGVLFTIYYLRSRDVLK